MDEKTQEKLIPAIMELLEDCKRCFYSIRNIHQKKKLSQSMTKIALLLKEIQGKK